MSKFYHLFVMVPQQHAFVVERFGRFHRLLEPGINFKLPVIDLVAYNHSLKERLLEIHEQTAITKDNVQIQIDGVLYYKVVNPEKASYEVSSPIKAISLLAQTSMRSEIGKIELDRTFEERESLNHAIKDALNDASSKWGIDCLRYEIKDIKPPIEIRRSMELQAESERIKRSKILDSEGMREAMINRATGEKQGAILRGEGEGSKILQEAKGICEALEKIAANLEEGGGQGADALRLKLTEIYLDKLKHILEKGNLLVLPNGGQSNFSFGSEKDALEKLGLSNPPKEEQIKELLSMLKESPSFKNI